MTFAITSVYLGIPAHDNFVSLGLVIERGTAERPWDRIGLGLRRAGGGAGRAARGGGGDARADRSCHLRPLGPPRLALTAFAPTAPRRPL